MVCTISGADAATPNHHFRFCKVIMSTRYALMQMRIANRNIEKILEFGMEDAFKRIEDEMAFHGSFKDLRSIIIAGHYGAWSDVGISKQFKYRKRDKTIIWWPDTGDILVRTTPEQFSDRLNDF